MPTVPLHTSPSHPPPTTPNPLPQLLQTPSGLAILEIQGTINIPPSTLPDTVTTAPTTPVGHLVFPHYNPEDHTPGSNSSSSSTAWQKTVHLYVGKHQRLTGEVKKLPKPLAVIRKREGTPSQENGGKDELEIAEIVYYKILFSSRPEPVGE